MTQSPPTASHDIRAILTDAQLQQLRRGYDRTAMNRAATAALVGPFPPATAFVQFVIDHFYDPKRWPPDRRELCVITYFTAQSGGDTSNLATHIYWGLMEGLTPEEIADTILLASVYSGIDNYTNAIGALRRVLTVLREIVEGPEPEQGVQCMNVVLKLRG